MAIDRGHTRTPGSAPPVGTLIAQLGRSPAQTALAVTWWPGSNDPLIIVEIGPASTQCPTPDRPSRPPATLDSLGLELFETWDDDVLVVPRARALDICITDRRLSLFVGPACWGSCDLPPDPAWRLIDSCPVGVMPRRSDRGGDPAEHFVRLLQQRRALIADAGVVRRDAHERPDTTA